MGQRTQLLVSFLITDQNQNEQQIHQIFHFQFGFGRVMASSVMNLVNSFTFQSASWRDGTLVERKRRIIDTMNKSIAGGFNISSEWKGKNTISSTSLEELKTKFFPKCDNNDGWCHLIISEKKEEKRLPYISFEIAFFKESDVRFNNKGECIFANPCTANEYLEQYPDYCSQDFLIMYEHFMKAHNIIPIYYDIDN